MTIPQQFLIYQSEDGSTRIDVMLDAETLWLTQKQLAELFGNAKGTTSEHIKHIFEDGEWTPEATVRLFRTVQIEGGREVTREVEHYNRAMGIRTWQGACSIAEYLVEKGRVAAFEKVTT